MFGNLGNDFLEGSFRRDVERGGPGFDQLFGDQGKDRLIGGRHGDFLFGEQHDDQLFAGRGGDEVNAAANESSTGNDVIRCGPGRDVARINRNDRILGCERIQLIANP
jgi:Ca2+-binding RTX toxin-like protein